MTVWQYLSLMCHLTCYFLSGMVYIGCSYLVFDCWQSAVQSLPQTQTSFLFHCASSVSIIYLNKFPFLRRISARLIDRILWLVLQFLFQFARAYFIIIKGLFLEKVWMLIFSAFVSLKFSIFFNSSCICSLLSLMTWLLFVLPVEPQVWCFYWSLHSRH